MKLFIILKKYIQRLILDGLTTEEIIKEHDRRLKQIDNFCINQVEFNEKATKLMGLISEQNPLVESLKTINCKDNRRTYNWIEMVDGLMNREKSYTIYDPISGDYFEATPEWAPLICKFELFMDNYTIYEHQ